MSMEDLWLWQSVHGWVLFLGIKSVYTTKVKEITEASASVGLLLAMAVGLVFFCNVSLVCFTAELDEY